MRRITQVPYFLPALVSLCISVAGIVVSYTHWEKGKLVRFALMDDAMISMSFARSLVEGCGLVWYCGAPKVEGYTNLGWVLYMAFWHLWGIPAAYTSIPIFLTGLFTLVWHIRGIYQLTSLFDKKAAQIAVWMTAIFPPIIFHHTSGLEAGFLAMLLTYFLYEMLRPSGSITRMAGIAAVGTLVRLDFILGVTAISGAKALSLRGDKVSNQTKAKKWEPSWLPIILALLVALATTFWRKSYYGLWVPNTYTLKVSSVPFSWRVLNGLIAALMHVGMNLPAWALAGVGFWAWRFTSQAWICMSVLGISMAYSIYVGGDIYESASWSNRFLMNGFAPLLLFASIGVIKISSSHITQGLLVLLVSYGLPMPLPSQIGYRWKGLFRSQETAYFPVDGIFPPKARLLIGPAGTTPYFLRDYEWIDAFGKVDTAVARRGLVVLCNGRPPFLYFPGHTRVDTFRLWDADGIVGATFISPSFCTDSTAPPLSRWWWFRFVRFVSPCKEAVPAWFPFPTPAFRERFCATYEPVEGILITWKRKAAASSADSSEYASKAHP
ncbi:MAG: hypothetical protein N3E49_06605 [Bacteroidia bacterium]|nr:hypothetical protein [Bacteroidia bacterium]